MTSIEFVKRTRATLRNAEFGFFGVCVYTRMQTPRFSGQPANAGDFVLVRIPSRPNRTSCENVGTVFPLLLSGPVLTNPALKKSACKTRHANARTNFHAARFARRQLQRAHTTLKGELRIRRYQQETPHAPQEAELRSWHRFGEAYSALRDWRPISGRSLLPIRRAMFRE